MSPARDSLQPALFSTKFIIPFEIMGELEKLEKIEGNQKFHRTSPDKTDFENIAF